MAQVTAASSVPKSRHSHTLHSNTEDLGTAGFGLSSLLAAELERSFIYADGELGQIFKVSPIHSLVFKTSVPNRFTMYVPSFQVFFVRK